MWFCTREGEGEAASAGPRWSKMQWRRSRGRRSTSGAAEAAGTVQRAGSFLLTW